MIGRCCKLELYCARLYAHAQMQVGLQVCMILYVHMHHIELLITGLPLQTFWKLANPKIPAICNTGKKPHGNMCL